MTRKTNGITQQATYSYQVGNATYSLPITYKFRLNKPRDNKLEDLTPFTQSLSVSNFNIILLNVAKEGLNNFKRNPEKMPYLLFDEEIEIVYDPQKAYNAIPVFIADKQYSNH